jgi:cell division protein FtsL
MITKAVGRSEYISVERLRYRRPRVSTLVVATALCCCVVLAVLFSFLANSCEEARCQYMDRLKKKKEIVETNEALKMELAAVTQKGYVELVVQERLGLKRPDDREVVVLK